MITNEEKIRQIGLNIAHYRKLRKMSQNQLAEACGISRGFLSHIEAPNVLVSFSIYTLLDIAKVLNIDPRFLLEFHEEEQRES